MAADVEGRQLYGTRIEKVNYQYSFQPQRLNTDTRCMIHVVPANVGFPIVSSGISRDGLRSSVRSLGCMPVASFYSNYYRAVPPMGLMDNVRVASFPLLFLEQRRSIPMVLLRTACLHFQTPCTKEKGPQLTSLLGPLSSQSSSPSYTLLRGIAERWYSLRPRHG